MTGRDAYPNIVDFLIQRDERGTMVVGDSSINLPFTPSRFFHVADVPVGEVRGNHAHSTCHQLLVCTRGRVVVRTDARTCGFQEHVLESPEHGVHIPPLVWASQQYETSDSQLLVLASEPYDAAEYIRDSATFEKLTGHRISHVFGVSHT